MEGDDAQNRSDSLKRLRRLLSNPDGSKVTLLGDTMLDRFHHGFANNMNSRAPVPVLKITRSEESPGASAHIAIGLTSFGMSVSFHSSVGDDRAGNSVVDTLNQNGVDTSNIAIAPERRTLTKIRFIGSRESLIDQEQILLQADRGPNEPLPPEISDSLTESALRSLKDSSALVISDYDKGVVSESGAHLLISTANESKIPSIVDPKLTGLEKSRGATVVIFEKRGLSLLTRRSSSLDTSETAATLLDDYSWDAILVLGGLDGVYLYKKDSDPLHLPCLAPAAVQQIGMHDAAGASLALALGSGLSIDDAAVLASAACECVLSANTSEEYIDKDTLGLWLDELSWQMQISDR